MSDLVKIARKRVSGELQTHWVGCEREHRECLIQRMADEIERLREWVMADARCPCCQQAQTCADDCTFAVDDPSNYEHLEVAREFLALSAKEQE